MEVQKCANNQNGLIDAYDISVVTTQLEDGIENPGTDRVAGTLSLSTPKQTYNAGETVEITVKGDSIKVSQRFEFRTALRSARL